MRSRSGMRCSGCRLTPQDSPLQTVHSWNTEVEGGAVEARYTDHFGNVVELVSASRDTEAIKRRSLPALVETYDKIGVFGAAQRPICRCGCINGNLPLTKPGKLIRELARSIEKGEPLDQLHGLKTALHQAMAYVPGATQTQTLAEDAHWLREKGSVRITPRPLLQPPASWGSRHATCRAI
jgi:hypothetical protein